MTKDEMFQYLNKIQEESESTKVLNAIATCFNEIKFTQDMVIDLQKKVNEIIGNWNQIQPEEETAAALNDEIQEDTHEAESVNDYTGPAV